MVLSLLFGSKLEKEFKEIVARGNELEVRYKGGENITISKVLKIFRDTIVLQGFDGKLKNNQITVKFLMTGITFDTTILKTGYDKNGNPIFSCAFPKGLKKTPNHRYRIFPNGKIKVLLSTNRGEKSLQLPIWELSESLISFANKTNVEVKIGTKFYQSLVTVGSMQSQLVDLQVAAVRIVEVDGEKCPVLMCVYINSPRALNEMVSTAKSLSK